MNYIWNEEAEKLGAQLIKKHHKHLDGVKIAYLFKEKPEPAKPRKKKSTKTKTVRAGKMEIWAKASRVPARYAELLKEEYEFLIEFDRAVWDQLKAKQQEALVDHELCHCGKDRTGCYMISHDLEEFGDVIKRHGLWRDSVRLFGESLYPLFDATVDPAFQHRGTIPGAPESQQPVEPPKPQPRRRPGAKGKAIAPGSQAPLMD